MNVRGLMLGTAAGSGALLALAFLPAGMALATTGVSVPCSGSSGGGAGLIAAINAANTGGGGTIRLAAGCTYRLTAPDNSGQLGPNGLPVITSAITIKGSGATITRRSSQPFRIAQIDGPGGNLTLTQVRISGGDTPAPGGGLFNFAGVLRLNASVVTGNTSAGGMMASGGGIASGTLISGPEGTLVLNASQVIRNTTSGGGGGILNHAGTAVLNSSKVMGNTAANGGGIASGPGNGGAPGSGSSLTLNASTISNNSATAGGGAPAGAGLANGDIAVIRSSTISNNTAPGGVGAGILNHGHMKITGSRVAGNVAPNDKSGNAGIGGGVANLHMKGVPGSGVLTIRGSVLTGNSASGFGGGLANAQKARATLGGSTVSRNSAATGGGLASQGKLTLNGSLVTRNTASAAGGIVELSGTVTLHSSTVTRNVPDNCEPPGAIAGCTG